MKKFIYLLVAAMLGIACADEKPHFLPLPGGSVEIGGIGATASSEASSLTDSDLTTYFSAETGDDNTVEVIVPCNAGEIVAYTLVASSLVDIPVMNIAKKALPLIGFFFIALLLITFIPQISLALVA